MPRAHGRFYSVCPATLLFAALLLPLPAAAQEGEEEPKLLTIELGILAEQDSNVNLGADINDPETGEPDPGELAKDDLVWRIQPRIGLTKSYKDHLFAVDLSGDLRQGSDTDLDEFNALATAFADLHFGGGFGLKIYDNYIQTAFDQALFLAAGDPSLAAADISETTTNTIGAAASFDKGERFKANLGYEHRDIEVGFENEFGVADERDQDVLTAKVEAPLPAGFVLYAEYANEEQDAAFRTELIYEENQAWGGVRWKGANRFKFWLQAGPGEIDFLEGEDYDNTMIEVGGQVNFSEGSFLRAAGGRDLYGETVFQIMFDHQRPEASSFNVLAQKTTENAFSPATPRNIFSATLFNFHWDHPAGEKLRVYTDVNYFKLLSEGTRNGFFESQRDETYLAKIGLDMDLKKWMTLGGHYQYSERSSTRDANEFDDSRAGITLRLIY